MVYIVAIYHIAVDMLHIVTICYIAVDNEICYTLLQYVILL